jgi:putative FmdB family regulatory protein
MPIYEFECCECCHRFERLILSSDKGSPECPECAHKKVRKLMSASGKVTLRVPAGYGGGAAPPSCTPGG